MNHIVLGSASTAPRRSHYLARKSLEACDQLIHSDSTDHYVEFESSQRPVRAVQSSSSIQDLLGSIWTAHVRAIDDSVRPWMVQTISTVLPQRTSAALPEQRIRELVENSVVRLYELAGEERFEDGCASNLSVGLETLIRQHPAAAISAIAGQLDSVRVPSAAKVETLRLLGRVDSPETRGAREALIVGLLNHGQLVVRDEALLALCRLGNGRSVEYVRAQLAREESPYLRRELEEAIRELSAL